MRAEGRVGIVATGDNHLSPLLPRLSPERRVRRRERLRMGLACAVECAIERGARLFVQAGDLFDSPAPSNADRAFVADCLRRLRAAGIECVGIGGNHDTPRLRTEHGGEAPQRVYAAAEVLRYFPRSDALAPVLLALGGLRLAVVGLSNNPVAAPGSDPLAEVVLDDPEGAIAAADVGLLVLHAGIDGLCQPAEGERLVMRTSLAALPPKLRVIVAGHIHRFAHARLDGRDAVVCGATERMEFGTAAGTAGFAWLEVDAGGLRHVEQIPVDEQPRADLVISSVRLWPGASARRPPPSDGDLPPGVDVREDAGKHAPEDAPGPVAILRHALAQVCTPETIVRLRLAGTLSLVQYHQLVLRDVLRYGQEHAFAFELDTSALALERAPSGTDLLAASGGPISPIGEVEALLAERLTALRGAADREDLRAAAGLVTARLRAAGRGEEGA
jgi:DNA repair exonuclease SbcCD nuclease subunit